MDELDILKKDWQKKEQGLPKLSYNEIYKMIWKKSSSIVKWILIISILELIVPLLLQLIPSVRASMHLYETKGLASFFIAVNIVSYAVIIYFIFQFYKRYKEISVLDNSKTLMNNIIRTRKTVKHYVIFSLSLFFSVSVIYALSVAFDPEMVSLLIPAEDLPKGMSMDKFKVIIAVAFIVIGLILTAIAGLIYFLLYGLLLRKLKKNYRELEHMGA